MKISMTNKSGFSSHGAKRLEPLNCTVTIDADNVDFLGDIIFQAGSVDCGCGGGPGCEVAPLSVPASQHHAKGTGDR